MAGRGKGRPKKEITEEEFKKLCSLQCTIEEIAGWFNCHEDTIRNYCKRTYDKTFQEVYSEFSVAGKISLRRTQFKIAEGGNATMAIWLGKQMLGQTDRSDVKIGGEADFVFNISPASSKPVSEEDEE